MEMWAKNTGLTQKLGQYLLLLSQQFKAVSINNSPVAHP